MRPLLPIGALALFATAGCGKFSEVKETCNEAPTSGFIDGPTPGYNYDYFDPDRPDVTWKIYGIINSCDDTTEEISVIANFGPDGTEVATFEEAEDGTLTATITHHFSDIPIGGNTPQGEIPVTIQGKNETEKNISLYYPYAAASSCASSMKPIILGDAILTPHDMTVGESFTVCFPMDGLQACDSTYAYEDPSRFSVQYYIANELYYAEASYPDGDTANGYYCATHPGLDLAQNYNYTAIIADLDYAEYEPDNKTETYPESFYVSAIETPIVSVMGLGTTYNVTDTVENIEAYCADDEAVVGWEIRYPDGTAMSLGSAVISSFTFDQEGTYIFTAVATGEGYETEEVQEVKVYAADVDIPTATIGNLGSAYYVGNTQPSITGYSDQEDVTYSWAVTRPDGGIDEFSGQTIAEYYFDVEGDYDFQLTVTSNINPEVHSHEVRSVGVYATSSSSVTPTLSVAFPYSGYVGEDITISVIAPDHDTLNYLINWGDGTGYTEMLSYGTTDFIHFYATQAKYTVTVMAEDQTDSTNYTTMSQEITISDTTSSDPVAPQIVIETTHNPVSGDGSGYNLEFNATGSYSLIGNEIVDYELIYDGVETESSSDGYFWHTYDNPGPGNNAYYTAYLTVTDEEGNASGAAISVSVWGD
ncbi:MAG: hypothetical protein WC890_07445 [Candidatus Margulisiibacteriota bacterium]